MATTSYKNGNDLEEDAKPRRPLLGNSGVHNIATENSEPCDRSPLNHGICTGVDRNSGVHDRASAGHTAVGISNSGNSTVSRGAYANHLMDSRDSEILYQRSEQVLERHPSYPRDHNERLLEPEDLYDLIIVHHKEDYDEVDEFVGWLRSLLQAAGLHDIKIELCDSEVFPPSHVCKVDDIINKGMRVLVFLTPKFPSDKNLNFFIENAIHKSRLEYKLYGKDLEREIERIMRYCLRPVHTEPSKTRRSKYQTPTGLGPIQGIDYFDREKRYAKVKAVDLVKGARKDRNILANLMEQARTGTDVAYERFQQQHNMNQVSGMEARHQRIEQPTVSASREMTSLEKRQYQGPSMSIEGKPVYYDNTGLLPQGSGNARNQISQNEGRIAMSSHVEPTENLTITAREANVVSSSTASNGQLQVDSQNGETNSVVNNPISGTKSQNVLMENIGHLQPSSVEESDRSSGQHGERLSFNSPMTSQTDVTYPTQASGGSSHPRYSSLSSRSLEVDADQHGDRQDEIPSYSDLQSYSSLDALNRDQVFSPESEGTKQTIIYHKHYHYHGPAEGEESGVSKDRKISESSQKNIYITGCNVVQVGAKGKIKATGLKQDQNPKKSKTERNDSVTEGQQVYQEGESINSSINDSISTQPYSLSESCDPSGYPQTTGELDHQPSHWATQDMSAFTSQTMSSSSQHPQAVELNEEWFASRNFSTNPAVIPGFSDIQTGIQSSRVTDNEQFLDENLNNSPGDLGAELQSFNLTESAETEGYLARNPNHYTESHHTEEETILKMESDQGEDTEVTTVKYHGTTGVVTHQTGGASSHSHHVVCTLFHKKRQCNSYTYSGILALPFSCTSESHSVAISDNLEEGDDDLD